jgi:NAD-dependent dihydropyrimidine dehydrogenase PreA subunit
MGIFIQISVDEKQFSPDMSRQIVRVCPVDIFEMDGERLTVKPEQEDECTLCRLCLDAAPAGALTILKTYSGEQLVSQGAK